MESFHGDRRKNQAISFPFTDSDGVLVTHERRSGKDRRRNRRGDDVAGKILNMLN